MAVRAGTINGLALCAGAGGLELGLRIALGDEYRCVVYVERDAYAAATLVARMADSTLDPSPVWDDVGTFDGKPWRGVVDVISAGFSCQPWSAAGKRLGIEDERWLWPDLDRVIREVGPELVFLENVPGLVHGGIEHVLRDLAASGFDAEWDCLSAAEVGASQLRQRLYILAHSCRSGWGEPWGRLLRVWSTEPNAERSAEAKRAVADANAPGCREQWRESANDGLSWADAAGRERPSATLDDSDTGRCGWTNNNVRSGRDCPERTSTTLGNPERQSLALGESITRDNGAQQPTVERAGSYWPPDRNYQGEWPTSFEPAVRRVANGLASGMVGCDNWSDRLRVLGNGVVPLAAAVAFMRLRERLMERTS